MLNYLSISNFTIIKQTEVHFKKGMSTITGETGAGKSILIDALMIVLGARIDKTLIPKELPSEISAIFEIAKIPKAKAFLKEHALGSDQECILRRVIYKDGKTRAFINGTPVTLTQLKAISQHIISIYGQNAHHSLKENSTQLERLDSYAGITLEVQALATLYHKITQLQKKIDHEKSHIEKEALEKELLSYQHEELNELSLKDDELETLDHEHSALANAENKTQTLSQIIEHLYESDQSIINQISQLTQLLSSHNTHDEFKTLKELFEQSILYLNETHDEAKQQLESLEINPQKLGEIESRLEQIYALARKHKIEPSRLSEHLAHIEKRLAQMHDSHLKLHTLIKEQQVIAETYQKEAQSISTKRHAASKGFAKEVLKILRELNIKTGSFNVQLKTSAQKGVTGIDHCEFLINFNNNTEAGSLDKIASGGELSRIGLAIHVVASKRIAPPTLIFDEVDVGISGATAEIVGSLLKEVSQNAQIICITHQAQVSIQGDQQYHIRKKHLKNETYSEIIELNPQERIEETARIIGGIDLTEKTLQHAKEMYERFHSH
ncbi:DNA repair protein RecN [Fangia hongkongensis]|uniref:DNA repair protein RecN n=1 Tax=Fangia hongkongensis TaxID=270495 RepID=UPI000365C67B|nr:DNA repair protein RecN [Fangia hongkongensis]MBK2124724.1 DNA repair protein RecN [Fangia hongkongensis]